MSTVQARHPERLSWRIRLRRDRTLLKRSFPFGPFMVAGALVGLVWGTTLGWPLGG